MNLCHLRPKVVSQRPYAVIEAAIFAEPMPWQWKRVEKRRQRLKGAKQEVCAAAHPERRCKRLHLWPPQDALQEHLFENTKLGQARAALVLQAGISTRRGSKNDDQRWRPWQLVSAAVAVGMLLQLQV